MKEKAYKNFEEFYNEKIKANGNNTGCFDLDTVRDYLMFSITRSDHSFLSKLKKGYAFDLSYVSRDYETLESFLFTLLEIKDDYAYTRGYIELTLYRYKSSINVYVIFSKTYTEYEKKVKNEMIELVNQIVDFMRKEHEKD